MLQNTEHLNSGHIRSINQIARWKYSRHYKRVLIEDMPSDEEFESRSQKHVFKGQLEARAKYMLEYLGYGTLSPTEMVINEPSRRETRAYNAADYRHPEKQKKNSETGWRT